MAARTLQELVAAAARLYPDRVAVTFSDGSGSRSPESLLYRDLAELSGELSSCLREKCPANNELFGIYCSDDLLTPVWILGILQTPAAYVPLDPEAPSVLSARVMKQCGLKYCAVETDILQKFRATLIKHASVEECVRLPKFKLTLVEIKPPQDAEHNRGPEQTGALPADGASDASAELKEVKCRDLAYVLHTSGTTGNPKIVWVPHACILPNILDLRSLFQMCAEDVVFLASPLTFDPSVVDIFLALSSGAQLLIVPSVIKKMPSQLARLLFRDHKATVLQVTPTLLTRFGHRVLKQEVLSSSSCVRLLALGGEACPSPTLLSSWREEGNKTHIYNIYGITEVSCWACAYRIPESDLQCSNTVSFVPLGTPLSDTVVEVRDEDGHVVTEGEGQVFIGGEHRVCLLDDEESVIPGTMRATGDWVTVKGSQMCYLGRKDRLIKRHGKRVNLDNLQQQILSLPQVEACAVALHEGVRLLAFIVASTAGEQEALAPPSEPSEQQDIRSSSADHLQPISAGGDVRRLILKQLRMELPAPSVPDTLVLVPALCLTPHGKVDVEALVRIYERQRVSLESSQGDGARVKQTLQSLWQESLGLPEDATVEEDSRFLFSGGDSLKALRLYEDILTALTLNSAELLEKILEGTFSDVLHHVEQLMLARPAESRLPKNRKRHTGDLSAAAEKRERKETSAAQQGGAITVIRRTGEVMQVGTGNPEMNESFSGEDPAEQRGGVALSLSLSWSSDTGRCVDASPVLLIRHRVERRSGNGEATVFIGSHSHRVQALDLNSGGLLWERVLGDRIEASAAVSRCGKILVVGCYDGCVYFLCTESGETRWDFKTGDAVKSGPAVDPHSGLVMVGSHDGHIYALDPEAQRCVWRRHCGGGAVFSSPYLHTSLRRLYAASLGGHLVCLNPDDGEVLWSHRSGVPFFSSPRGSKGHVVIGSVDKHIYCFSEAGTLVWQFLTKGPVFSSPCLTPDGRRVLCGSHDGHLYCLNCSDGTLVWTFQTTGQVYSSPCVFDGSIVGRRGPLVAAASTDGTVWILDEQDGQTVASFTLPGELFSSPVVFGHSLVVGCRNDYVYCLKLKVKEEL